MPLVATIGNVRIRVYLLDTGRHHRPHFHAASPDVVGIPGLDVMAGVLPPATRRAVLEWAAANKPRVIDAWNVANPGAPVYDH